MKSKLGWLIVVDVVILLLVYIGGSWFFSTILIDAETQTLEASRAGMIDAGLPDLPTPEEVSIVAGDVTLSGFFYDNELEGQCAVLLLHGYTGTRYSALQYAPLFWERGCDLLAYDARGHGRSTDAFHTYGYFEKTDGQAAYEWLLTQSDLEPDQVGVAGVSYGAATSLQMLPLIPDAAFVLADSAYESLPVIARHQAAEQFGSWTGLFVPGAFFFSEIRADFDVAAVSPKNAIANTTVPVLLVHSKTDEFTPAAHSETIYANSNPATTQLFINEWDARHARDIFVDYEAYALFVDDFLTAYVPEFGLNSGR